MIHLTYCIIPDDQSLEQNSNVESRLRAVELSTMELIRNQKEVAECKNKSRDSHIASMCYLSGASARQHAKIDVIEGRLGLDELVRDSLLRQHQELRQSIENLQEEVAFLRSAANVSVTGNM